MIARLLEMIGFAAGAIMRRWRRLRANRAERLASAEMDASFATYMQLLPGLVRTHPGQFVVIEHGVVRAIYPTWEAATAAAKARPLCSVLAISTETLRLSAAWYRPDALLPQPGDVVH